MTTLVLNKTDKELTGADLAIGFTWEDVDGYTSAAAQAAFSVTAGMKVQCVGMKLPTAFDRASTGALAVTVGDGDAANALMASTVIALDGTEILYHIGGNPKAYLADDTVDVFFTDSGAMTYTSGEVWFYFSVSDMTKWRTS